MLIDWDPFPAIAAGVGPVEARRFLDAEDFDFMGWNHGPDSGGSWSDAEAWVAAERSHWLDHALSYRTHFPESLVGEVPGSVAILRELHAAGVPSHGLTNWSDELYPHAPARFDFLELFESVLVSGTEGIAKPDPRVYELVAERSGLPLDRLVFIDDRAANVAAAAALGMAAFVFTDAATLRVDLRSLGLPV